MSRCLRTAFSTTSPIALHSPATNPPAVALSWQKSPKPSVPEWTTSNSEKKDLSTRELESLARDAMRVIREARQPATENRKLENRSANQLTHGCSLLAVHAEGVHLRSDDITPQEVRAAWRKCGVRSCGGGHSCTRQLSPRDSIVAVSCHSPAEVAQAAANGATFAVFAPVFEKKDAPEIRPTGLVMLEQACQTNIPVRGSRWNHSSPMPDRASKPEPPALLPSASLSGKQHCHCRAAPPQEFLKDRCAPSLSRRSLAGQGGDFPYPVHIAPVLRTCITLASRRVFVTSCFAASMEIAISFL